MSIELKNEFGKIDITNDVIAQVVGEAAIECYGIVGMASRHQIRDGLTDNPTQRKLYARCYRP